MGAKFLHADNGTDQIAWLCRLICLWYPPEGGFSQVVAQIFFVEI